jgi:hypothetical protein
VPVLRTVSVVPTDSPQATASALFSKLADAPISVTLGEKLPKNV